MILCREHKLHTIIVLYRRPSIFMGLDHLASSVCYNCNGCMLLQDHTCAGLTAAAARGAVSAIAQQATALGCAVNVRMLSYDEAAAVQVTRLGCTQYPLLHCCQLSRLNSPDPFALCRKVHGPGVLDFLVLSWYVAHIPRQCVHIVFIADGHQDTGSACLFLDADFISTVIGGLRVPKW